MSVKDVFGREVSKQNHMIIAHSPTSMLIEELRKRKMSDREIMDAKGYGRKSINNPELHSKLSNGWEYSDTKVKTTKNYMPDQKWHRYVSFIKSGVRIIGYGLIPFNLVLATGVLIFSEIIGIIEELV